MIYLAVAAVAAALIGEPAIPKSDEAFFGRVVATAPAGTDAATLFLGRRRVAVKDVLGGRVTFGVRRAPLKACKRPF